MPSSALRILADIEMGDDTTWEEIESAWEDYDQQWNLSHTVMQRFTTGVGFTTSPTDTPASATYRDGINQPLNIQRSLFAPGATSGPSETSVGVMTIDNTDGRWDFWDGYEFAGRKITQKLWEEGTPVSTAVTLFTGRIEQVVPGWNEATIRLRDLAEDLDVPVQPELYAGDNVLPAGLEGGADLKGKPRPIMRGLRRRCPLVSVNTDLNAFECGGGEPYDDLVEDDGSPLVRGTDYATSTAFNNPADKPDRGGYRFWSDPDTGRTFIRTGSTPTGTLAADLFTGASDADRTLAALVLDLITEWGFVDAGLYVAGDFTQLDTDYPGEVGIWTGTDAMTRADVLNKLCSPRVWTGFDRLGRFRIAVLKAPTGSAAFTLKQFGDAGVLQEGTDFDIVGDPGRGPLQDEWRGVLPWRVTLRYQENLTVQQDPAGIATGSRLDFIQKQWREAVSEDQAYKNANPNAPELIFDCALDGAGFAADQADALFEFYTTPMKRVNVDTHLLPALVPLADLGAEGKIKVDRFTYASGAAAVVIGLSYDGDERIGLDLAVIEGA